MRIAILSVSEKGKNLSSRLKALLDEDPTIIEVTTFHKNVKDNINLIFNDNSNNNTSYDAIIGIMATGILIRNISDKIRDKTTDPAILSMDDNGKYVVSLVSGHLGGANELTKKIAKLIESEPVITTATDTSGKVGIDTLASKLYWDILNKNEILDFNKAILEEKHIKIYINLLKNDKIRYKQDIEDYLKNQKKNTLEIIDLKNSDSSIKSIQSTIFSHDTTQDQAGHVNQKVYKEYEDSNIIANFDGHAMFFKPRKIVLGIGARANISKEKVIAAIQTAISNLNLTIERINSIATVDIKKNEKGILEAVKEIDKPLDIVTVAEIKEFKSPEISNSEFVQEKFDIPGVAEPTALIVAKKGHVDSKLIHKKIAIDGVTVAVAVSK